MHIDIGIAATHRLGEFSHRGAACRVDNTSIGDRRIADPFAINVETRSMESGQENDNWAILSGWRTMNVRLRDAYTLVDPQLELNPGFRIV